MNEHQRIINQISQQILFRQEATAKLCESNGGEVADECCGNLEQYEQRLFELCAQLARLPLIEVPEEIPLLRAEIASLNDTILRQQREINKLQQQPCADGKVA